MDGMRPGVGFSPQMPLKCAGTRIDPPPSLALVLGSTQSLSQNRNSKITELVIDAGEVMVTGSKTVQIEVKE